VLCVSCCVLCVLLCHGVLCVLCVVLGVCCVLYFCSLPILHFFVFYTSRFNEMYEHL
jgi:hypothetical protein